MSEYIYYSQELDSLVVISALKMKILYQTVYRWHEGKAMTVGTYKYHYIGEL